VTRAGKPRYIWPTVLDSGKPSPIDYATAEYPSHRRLHLVLAVGCLGIGALLCGVGIPCMIADDFNPENMPTDVGVILVGGILCALGMHLKGRHGALLKVDNIVAMSDAEHWRCPSCQEAVPLKHDVCWSCGADRTGTRDPSFVPAVGFTPQCDSCGYLLIGLTTHICPECGTPFDPSKKDTLRDVGQAT